MGFKLKNINAINGVATSHGAGIKKVLCSNFDDKAMTVDAGTYVMVHAGTKHGIKAVTDCKMITVGCTHHYRYFKG